HRLHAIRARRALEVLFAAVLAGQEAARETEIADDAKTLATTKVRERAFERNAIVEVVPRLQRLEARQTVLLAHGERRLEARGLVIRGTDRADLAGRNELAEGTERLLERSARIV